MRPCGCSVALWSWTGTTPSAKALAAIIHNIRVVQNWGDQTEIERGIQLAREALADHRDDPDDVEQGGYRAGVSGA